MEDLFTVAEKSAVIHYIKNKVCTSSYTCYSCCGKVSTIFKGKRMLGYILAETKDTFLVRLANNKFEHIKRPKFYFLEEQKRCIYIYCDIVYNERVITEYWSMRMIITMKGE